MGIIREGINLSSSGLNPGRQLKRSWEQNKQEPGAAGANEERAGERGRPHVSRAQQSGIVARAGVSFRLQDGFPASETCVVIAGEMLVLV